MDPVLLYITAADREEAISIAHTLVNERLVACANVVEGATSIYWWGGDIERAQEALVVAKSLAPLVDRITARVKEQSSHDNPCVIALPIIGGSAEYLAWIGKEVRV